MTASRGKLLLGFLVALALLAVVFRGVEWAELSSALGRANRIDLLLVVVAALATYLARAWRWGALLQPLGRVGFRDLFSATVVGFMSGFVVPRAGEILRPWLVARRYPIATSAGFASIVIERLLDLITVLLLLALYLFVLPLPAAQNRGAQLEHLKHAGALAGLGALAILVVLLALHSRADRTLALLGRLLRFLPAALARPVEAALRSFTSGLAVLQAPFPHLALVALQSVVVWLSIAAGVYFNNRAFGVDLPFHSTFLILAFLTVGVTVPTPGMAGGFHLFYMLALHEVFGVDRNVGVAAALVSHALTNLPVIGLGLYYLGREGLTMGRVAAIAGEDGGAPKTQEATS